MNKKYTGSCHCKKISFNFFSLDRVTVIKCNCSICKPINYLHLIIPHSDFFLINGKKNIITYKFGTKKAIHYFCNICGIKSFYQPRSHKKAYSINYLSIQNPPKVKKWLEFDGNNYDENIKSLLFK
jgi:hypothetical protein